VHRTWYIAPVVFVVLSAVGLQNAIATWMVARQPAGAVAAMPVLPVPTVAVVAVASATPTVGAPTPSATAATLVVSSGRAADQVTISGRLEATATPQPSPTLAPATRTPTVGPLDIGVAPRRIGNDPLPKFGAKEVVIVDGESGAILFEQAAHRRVAPASTTKIVTSLVALQRRDWAERLIARFDETELVDSTLMGLRPGDDVSLEDLLYGLMLPSGNDAALAIANHVAGSKSGFAELMNQKTRELGLADSHWVNPHGLDAPGHYSSAWDMVQFARHGMRDPRFQALSAARLRTVKAGGRQYEVPNLNRVLGQVPGADGVKIGYTEDAGRTIVASATRNGHRVYIGAFHSADLVGDTKPLFEWVFKNYTWG
jgi:D-alanyl-D-alanine carboxypeptidase